MTVLDMPSCPGLWMARKPDEIAADLIVHVYRTDNGDMMGRDVESIHACSLDDWLTEGYCEWIGTVEEMMSDLFAGKTIKATPKQLDFGCPEMIDEERRRREID